MTAVVVDRRDARLSLKSETLVIGSPEGQWNVPVSRIERLVVRSPATIDAAVLARLWAQGAGVLVLSGRRSEPTARFFGRPHNDVVRRLAQYALQNDEPMRLAIVKRLIVGKLRAQAATIAELAERRPALRAGALRIADQMPELLARVSAAESVDAVRGFEGAAAAAYWPVYADAFAPSLEMQGRNRRPPRDPVNAALSLAYTIATFEMGRQAQMIGLDPMLGALHAPSFGRDSLACDLVEPLRPRIDLWVWDLFRERVLRPEHFSRDRDGRCLMGKAGRGAFYGAFEERMTVWSRWARLAVRDFARRLRPNAAPDAFGSIPLEAVEP